jgi:two-component system NtrC family sensor kinase
LPLVEASTEADPPLAPAQLTPLLPLRILAVDDEPMMTRAVVRMLRPSGHVVSVAASGEEALEKLTEQMFDVVVSDMGMGAGMNGWELADAVKRRWPGVRFLLATGWGAAIDPAVLTNPYHPADLLRALARNDAAN